MNRIRRHIIIFFFTLGSFSTTGQIEQSLLETENIRIHFDKSFYLSGEVIHYIIYFNNKAPVSSKIVHIDLVDAEGHSYMNQVLEVENNTAHGSFNIPYGFREANYLFRCYTRWNLNFGNSVIYYKVIPIYNAFIEELELLEINDSIAEPFTSSEVTEIKHGQLSIDPNKDLDNIHTRDKLGFKIYSKTKNRDQIPAQLSVSIVHEICLKGPESGFNFPFLIMSGEIEENSSKFNAEDSLTFRGIIRDPETQEPISSRVLSIYNVKEGDFSRLRSRKGKFEFKLPLFKGITDLQIINMNPFQQKVPDVEWIPISQELPPDPEFNESAKRTGFIREYILNYKLRNKINEIFYPSLYDTIELTEPPTLPFEPDRSYDMSKYQLVRDVYDFFREGVLNTNFYQENGKDKIRLFNAETNKFFMTSPWFVVDGHFIFNDSLVHHIPFNHLSRIDVFNTNESIFRNFEPIMIQGGVVAIYTKNNFLIDYIREQPNTLTVYGIPESDVDRRPVNRLKPGTHETPDFNPMILWDPDLKTDDSGKAKIEFYTNDLTGTFVIRVRGMDEEGNPLHGQISFEVKP